MAQIELETVSGQLVEFVRLVRAGEEVVITEHDTPVARLIASPRQRKLGTATGQVTVAVGSLPTVHRDPFDRMLVAQCIIESLPIISADVISDDYRIERIW